MFLQCDGDSLLSSSVFTLVAEGETISTSKTFLEATAMWIFSFYVFNFAYPGCLSRSLTFIQKVLLNIHDELPPLKPVVSLTHKLNVENMTAH